ncbi:MAG TPA: Fe-S protein assembly co-chaperone HscB [Burkholderiaceae bacterium]|nr:Fe-S protein assembly co-chaperone HscB [Burkholderiaceae bacterium]
MKQNYFELFGLAETFELDGKQLDAAFRQTQARVHPDRYANGSAAEKRMALQWATLVNEAYQTLRDPLSRARYLCELHGVSTDAESNVAMPADFLIQQMTWREQLEDALSARDERVLNELSTTLNAAKHDEVQALSGLLASQNYELASTHVRRLMFLERFAHEIDDAFLIIEAG